MENNKQTSKMQTWEWIVWFVLSVLVDVVQIILNLALGSGVLINRFITVIFGGAMGAYLHWRGVSLVNPRVLLRFGGTFVAEFIPMIDFLPMWAVGTALTWITTKSSIAAKATGVVNKTSNIVNGATGHLNDKGTRAPSTGTGPNSNLAPLVVDGMRRPMK